jgi:hypothetical protein
VRRDGLMRCVPAVLVFRHYLLAENADAATNDLRG